MDQSIRPKTPEELAKNQHFKHYDTEEQWDQHLQEVHQLQKSGETPF